MEQPTRQMRAGIVAIVLWAAGMPLAAQDLTVAETLALGTDAAPGLFDFTLTPAVPPDAVVGGARQDDPALAPDRAVSAATDDLVLGHRALPGFGVLVDRSGAVPRFGGLAFAPRPGLRFSAKGRMDWGTRDFQGLVRLHLDF